MAEAGFVCVVEALPTQLGLPVYDCLLEVVWLKDANDKCRGHAREITVSAWVLSAAMVGIVRGKHTRTPRPYLTEL